MNEEWTGLWLRQRKHIPGHLRHRYFVMINRHSSYSKTFKVVYKELQVKNKHNASETLEKNRNKIKQNE
jgi:hypothetical protein